MKKPNRKIDILVDKIGLSEDVAKNIYAFSKKYCVWIGNIVKNEGGGSLEFFNNKKELFESIIKNLFQVDNKPKKSISSRQ